MEGNNNELSEFIKSQLDQGVSKEDIRTTLLNQGGWDNSDLDVSFSAFEEGIPVPVPVKSEESEVNEVQTEPSAGKSLAGIPPWGLLVITIVFVLASLRGTYLYDALQYFFYFRLGAAFAAFFAIAIPIVAIVTYNKLKKVPARLEAGDSVKFSKLLVFWNFTFVFVLLDFLALLFMNALGGLVAFTGQAPVYILATIVKIAIITLFILLIRGAHKNDFTTLKKKLITISLPVIVLILIAGFIPISETLESKKDTQAYQEALIENPNTIAITGNSCPDCQMGYYEGVDTLEECKAHIYKSLSKDGRYTDDEVGICGFKCKSIWDERNPKKRGEDLCEEYVELEIPTENYYVASGSPRIDGHIHLEDWRTEYFSIQGSPIAISSPEKYSSVVDGITNPTFVPLYEKELPYNIGVLYKQSICNSEETNISVVWDYQKKPNEIIPHCIVFGTFALIKTFEEYSSYLDKNKTLSEERLIIGGKEFLKVESKVDGADNTPPGGMSHYIYIRKVPAEEYGGFSNYFATFEFSTNEEYLELYEQIISTAVFLPE